MHTDKIRAGQRRVWRCRALTTLLGLAAFDITLDIFDREADMVSAYSTITR